MVMGHHHSFSTALRTTLATKWRVTSFIILTFTYLQFLSSGVDVRNVCW